MRLFLTNETVCVQEKERREMKRMGRKWGKKERSDIYRRIQFTIKQFYKISFCSIAVMTIKRKRNTKRRKILLRYSLSAETLKISRGSTNKPIIKRQSVFFLVTLIPEIYDRRVDAHRKFTPLQHSPRLFRRLR